MTYTTTCHKCQKTITYRGDATGHCAKCHETFSSESAFDAHQRLEEGKVTCLNPATYQTEGGSYFELNRYNEWSYTSDARKASRAAWLDTLKSRGPERETAA